MRNQWSFIIGITLLVVAIVILCSAPGMFWASGLQFVDTELRGTSDTCIVVRTLSDFGDAQVMEALPLQQAGWSRSDEDLQNVATQLGAKTLLTWSCRHESTPHLIWFLILQSKDVSAFHPPAVCYQSQGWDIQEEEIITVRVDGNDWIESNLMNPSSDGTPLIEVDINVNKLVITKQQGEMTWQRRVVLYYYIKPSKSVTPEEVTMIRVSAPVPVTGSYEHILKLEKLIIADTIPLMFESANEEKIIARRLLDNSSLLGGLVIAVIVLIPIGLIMYPHICKRMKPADH